jgi:hypothetical protein
MRIISIRFVETSATLQEVPASRLDKRSEPKYEESSHKDYTFYCLPLWKNALKGRYKIHLTTVDPAKWVKQSFKLTDPAKFKSTPLPGINKTKVLKYVKFLKEGNVDMPPVLFAKNEQNRKMIFIDGNHRLMASFVAGLKSIPCYQFDLFELLRSSYKDPATGKMKKVCFNQRAEDEDDDIY